MISSGKLRGKMRTASRKPIIIWLLLVALCVWGMIVLGGLTRLTESGLSIVEWKVVSGILPPLTETAWEAEFEQYRTSPQYHKINKGMTLSEFKGIFWLEYLHRLAGRAIGLVFLLPLVYFAARKQLPGWLGWQLAGIFCLGGLQGAIGWYMVKSGLVNEPMVSQYRLALHLGMAFLLMGLLIIAALELTQKPTSADRLESKWSPRIAGMVVAICFVQVLLGALVAGLNAGLTYNTFPLMDGKWLPSGLYLMEPAYINHFENITMVQFQHRVGALVLVLAVLALAVMVWRDPAASGVLKCKILLLVGVLAVQVVLGIATLLLQVPVELASAHQAVAALFFALSVWVWYEIHARRHNLA